MKIKIKKTMRLVVLFLLFIGLTGATMPFNNGVIVLQINNVKSGKGQVAMQLLDKNQKVLQQLFVPAQNGTVRYEFKNLPNGFYALQIYHDENGNQKMDFGLFGAPTEGYAFSNNAKGFMSAPKFAAQLFELKQHTTQTIQFIY